MRHDEATRALQTILDNDFHQFVGPFKVATWGLRVVSRAFHTRCSRFEHKERSRTHWAAFHTLIRTMRWSYVSYLGFGCSSRVWLFTDLQKRKEYAIKIVDCKSLAQSWQFKASSVNPASEALMLSALNHRHIVQLFGWTQVPGSLLFALEYVPGGTLLEYVNTNGGFSDASGHRISLQIARTVQYLHARGVLHRDFKMENVLLTTDADCEHELKLCDFGLARYVSANDRCYTIVGTPVYMAPELHSLLIADGSSPHGYSFPVDMWSIGITLYALHTVLLPFDGPDLSRRVLRGIVHYDKGDWSHLPRAYDVVSRLLCGDIGQRCTAPGMLQLVHYSRDSLEAESR